MGRAQKKPRFLDHSEVCYRSVAVPRNAGKVAMAMALQTQIEKGRQESHMGSMGHADCRFLLPWCPQMGLSLLSPMKRLKSPL